MLDIGPQTVESGKISRPRTDTHLPERSRDRVCGRRSAILNNPGDLLGWSNMLDAVLGTLWAILTFPFRLVSLGRRPARTPDGTGARVRADGAGRRARGKLPLFLIGIPLFVVGLIMTLRCLG